MSLSALLFSAVLVGCVEDVAKDKVAAEVAEAPTPTPEAAAAPEVEPAGEKWAIDASQSKIHALGAKITKKHDIVWNDWSGHIAVDDGQVTSITYEVDMNSLESDAERLTGHLKSPDFFEVEKYPKATFKSTKIEEKAGEKGATHRVTGDLMMRGVTKQVTFPMQIEVKDNQARGATEFAINRKDWGINYPGKPDDLIQDNVVLTVEFIAPKPTS